MFGGPPIFMPQQMPQGMPQQGMPPGAPPMPRAGVPQSQAGGYVPPRLTPPSRPASQQAAATQPAPRLARGARPSEPERGAVAIPSPEELGVAPAKGAAPKAPEAALDWSATRRQMTEMGVSRFQAEQLPGGRTRFTCWLGGHEVQADGATESEAVRLCLERARQRVAKRP